LIKLRKNLKHYLPIKIKNELPLPQLHLPKASKITFDTKSAEDPYDPKNEQLIQEGKVTRTFELLNLTCYGSGCQF